MLACELRAPVYDDVVTAFKSWKSERKGISIFSSGSVFAQKLLFANTTFGDLTNYVDQYFDTTTGAKANEESYRAITNALALAPADVHFVSDVVAELDAARAAGMATSLCVRPGRPDVDSSHTVISTFHQLLVSR